MNLKPEEIAAAVKRLEGVVVTLDNFSAAQQIIVLFRLHRDLWTFGRQARGIRIRVRCDPAWHWALDTAVTLISDEGWWVDRRDDGVFVTLTIRRPLTDVVTGPPQSSFLTEDARMTDLLELASDPIIMSIPAAPVIAEVAQAVIIEDQARHDRIRRAAEEWNADTWSKVRTWVGDNPLSVWQRFLLEPLQFRLGVAAIVLAIIAFTVRMCAS